MRSKHTQDFDDQGQVNFWAQNENTFFVNGSTAVKQKDHIELATDIAIEEIKKYNRTVPAHLRESTSRKKVRRQVREVLRRGKAEHVGAPLWVHVPWYKKFFTWIKRLFSPVSKDSK